MSGSGAFDVITCLRVTERIDHAHPKHPDYPLLPGDVLRARGDGTFNKIAPGLCIVGFELTADQVLTCRPDHLGVGPSPLVFIEGERKDLGPAYVTESGLEEHKAIIAEEAEEDTQ